MKTKIKPSMRRARDHEPRWECRASGHHEAMLPDGALLVARFERSGNWDGWQCHRKRGEDMRWLASARYWKDLRRMVKEMGEDAYR